LPALKPEEISKPEFDDSKWDTLKTGQRLYVDSCWIRAKFVIPEKIFGKVASGKIVFKVSVDDYGYLWVNGNYIGYIPWDGEFDLTDKIKPGEDMILVIKAVNTGGPLRLLILVLTILKKSEDADAWVIQFYESQGKETEANIVLPFSTSKIFRSNFLEEDKEELKPEGGRLRMRVKPNSVVTLKVYK